MTWKTYRVNHYTDVDALDEESQVCTMSVHDRLFFFFFLFLLFCQIQQNIQAKFGAVDRI